MLEPLSKYIQAQLAAGLSIDKIRELLLNNSEWTNEDIDAAIAGMQTGAEVPQKPVATPQEAVSLSTVAKGSAAKLYALVGASAVIVLVAAGVLWSFAGSNSGGAPYAADDVIIGIADSFAEVTSSRYTLTGTLEVEDREPGARPFEIEITPEVIEYREQYARDVERVEAVESILGELRYLDENNYPTTLDALVTEEDPDDFWYTQVVITDPLTGEPFAYTAGQGDFKLEVYFETTDVLSELESGFFYGDNEAPTIDYQDQLATFTKNSGSYYYVQSEVPKTYFEELSEMAVYLPPEFFIGVTMTSASDFSKEVPDWEFSADLEGDFGDLIYKVAGDAKMKDNDMYFRLRNMPGLFAGFFSFEKGTWIRVPEGWVEENEGADSIFMPLSMIPDQEDGEEIEELQEELAEFMMEVIRIANEEEVVTASNNPTKEDKDGESLYRYDLQVNAEGAAPFFERVIEESEKNETTREMDFVVDQSMMEYLKSDRFDEVVAYFNDNVDFVFWIDSKGFVRSIEYSMRIVPPDSAEPLANKQARLKLQMDLDDINQSIKIKAPSEYKEIDALAEDFFDPFSEVQSSAADASVKQSLSNLRVQAELSYNENGFTYAEVCNDDTVQWMLENAQDSYDGGLDGSTVCNAGDSWYVAQAMLSVDPETEDAYQCVDSTGYLGSQPNKISSSAESCNE